MQVRAEIKGMFSYSIFPIILLAIVLIVLWLAFREKKEKPKEVRVSEVPRQDRNSIKKKYLAMLDALVSDITSGKIKNRGAYQRLSSIIRNFCFEMTNIKVQACTLLDIKALNMPELYELVEEYYDPEFSKNKAGNILESIEKTRGVIEKWN